MELSVSEMTNLLQLDKRQPSFFKTRLPTGIYSSKAPLIKRLEDRFLKSSKEGLSYEEFGKQLDKYKEICRPAPREKSKRELINEWKREHIKNGFVKPLVRFRRAVKSVQVLLRATDRNSHTGHSQTSGVLSWVQIHNDLSVTKRGKAEQGLLFDPSDYRAKRETQLSSEAKAILSMDPASRTKEQLHVALVALNQSVEAFSEFPIKMQESLVRVGFYEHFEAKRVIIRQGHFADNFYMMLSGMAIVTILETDRHGGQEVRTAAFLKKGNSFGELALMHGSLRSATVTCKDSVELLAVTRQDFINIFMHVEKDTIPDHIQFLSIIDVFLGWPIDKIPYDDPKICLFTYFRRGVLLCKDSNVSDWVYIIKTGTCKVLKAIQVGAEFMSPALKRSGERNNETKDKSSIPSERSTPTKPGPPYLIRHSKKNTNQKSKRKGPSVRPKDTPRDEVKSSSAHLRQLEEIYSERHPLEEKELDDWEKSLCEKRTDLGSETDTALELNGQMDTNMNGEVNMLPSHTESTLISNQFKHIDEGQSREKNNKELRKPSARSSEINADTVFVQVTRLGPKDVFGLEHPILNFMTPTTSLSLVSDGAECVLINRRFFMQHLQDIHLKRLRLSMQPYPTEDVLKRKLHDQRKWTAYKTMALNDHLSFTRHIHETLSLYY